MEIVSIASSKKKGTPKVPVEEADLLRDHGIDGDAHAGNWHRQVSFLAAESIEKARDRGLNVTFGNFAENIATRGIDWETVPVGALLYLGDSAQVEITQKGKECHNKCAIYYLAGDCIMPREGIFARVIEGGKIRCGDSIRFQAGSRSACCSNRRRELGRFPNERFLCEIAGSIRSVKLNFDPTEFAVEGVCRI